MKNTTNAQTAAHSSPFWGELTPGGYNIGFHSFIVSDYSRRYVYPAKQSLEPRNIPRPIPIQVWYPTRVKQQANIGFTGEAVFPYMPYGEYLKTNAGKEHLKDFVEQLNRFTLNACCEEEMGSQIADLSPEEVNSFQHFLQLPTACIADAPLLDKPFPLLVYHAGLCGCVVDNPILLEFITSHGYIVATSSFHPEHGLSFGVDGDTNRSIKDLNYILQVLCRQYPVDAEKIAVIGHSFGASAVMEFAFEPSSAVKAVISLDSTREWNTIDDGLFKSIEERLSAAAERFTTPLMVVSKATQNPSFQHYQKLKYAKRYYLSVKHLAHNDFVIPGVTASTDSLTTYDQPIQKASKVICECVLEFLNHYIKRSISDQTQLVAAFRKIDQETQYLSIHTEAATSPFIAEQLLAAILTEGIEHFQQQQIAALSPTMLMRIGYALQERGQYKKAATLYQAINQHFPKFSQAYEYLGNIYNNHLNDPAAAIASYQVAREVLTEDSTLTILEKEYSRQCLTGDINSLQNMQSSLSP